MTDLCYNVYISINIFDSDKSKLWQIWQSCLFGKTQIAICENLFKIYFEVSGKKTIFYQQFDGTQFCLLVRRLGTL